MATTLTINGESRTLPDALTVAQLLERLGHACALNPG